MTADNPRTTAGRGHGDKLDRKREAAIAALLTQPTIEKAAGAAGVSEATLSRWLQTPEFASAYRAARDRALEQTISVLHKATTGAVGALIRNLKCGTPSVEVRAAIGILDQTMKAREMLEMDARLRGVEELISATESHHSRR